MADIDIIRIFRPESRKIEFQGQVLEIKPISLWRFIKLLGKLKKFQDKLKLDGDQDAEKTLLDVLEQAGSEAGEILGILAGVNQAMDFEEISLVELSALIKVISEVNNFSEILVNFRKAAERLEPAKK